MTAKAKPKAQAKATKPKTKAKTKPKAQTPPPTLIQRIQTEHIAPLIHWIRGAKVMLDCELAALYGVETRTLKQAVRRNKHRFPDDFMFPLTKEEIDFVVSQNVIPHKKTLGGAAPLAFTEQGVAMLSSVLRSHRAVEVNLAIMRTFVQLRKLMDNNQNLSRKINNLEKNTTNNSPPSSKPSNNSSPKTKPANANKNDKSASTPSAKPNPNPPQP